LISGSADPLADLGEEPGRDFRHEPGCDQGHGSEHGEPNRVVGEHDAEREHRAEIGDEAGRKDDLPELGLVEAGLDHHRIDHRNRGGGQRNAGDLRFGPGPAEQIARRQQASEIRRQKADDPDADARPEIPAHDLDIDLGSGQEREEDRAETRQVVDPRGQRQSDQISGDRADDDLDQRHRDRGPDRDQRGGKRKADPQRRRKPQVLHCTPLVLSPPPAAGANRFGRRSRDLREHKKTARRRLVRLPPLLVQAVGVISRCGRLRGDSIPIHENYRRETRQSIVRTNICAVQFVPMRERVPSVAH
jgi:hypothetical protein